MQGEELANSLSWKITHLACTRPGVSFPAPCKPGIVMMHACHSNPGEVDEGGWSSRLPSATQCIRASLGNVRFSPSLKKKKNRESRISLSDKRWKCPHTGRLNPSAVTHQALCGWIESSLFCDYPGTRISNVTYSIPLTERNRSRAMISPGFP